jgi:hypothetical protein
LLLKTKDRLGSLRNFYLGSTQVKVRPPSARWQDILISKIEGSGFWGSVLFDVRVARRRWEFC